MSTSCSTKVLHEVDLAGNVSRETRIGILQQQLLAKRGRGGPLQCRANPAPIGAACLGAFHHDDIRTLPNGETAVLVDIERIFPPRTQGDTSGLPVDIIGDMIIVLDSPGY